MEKKNKNFLGIFNENKITILLFLFQIFYIIFELIIILLFIKLLKNYQVMNFFLLLKLAFQIIISFYLKNKTSNKKIFFVKTKKETHGYEKEYLIKEIFFFFFLTGN
jgi:hypothetical protein